LTAPAAESTILVAALDGDMAAAARLLDESTTELRQLESACAAICDACWQRIQARRKAVDALVEWRAGEAWGTGSSLADIARAVGKTPTNMRTQYSSLELTKTAVEQAQKTGQLQQVEVAGWRFTVQPERTTL